MNTDFNIFPNPVLNEIQFNGLGNVDYSVSFYNQLGMLVYVDRMHNNSINTQALSPGFYIMRITDSNSNISGNKSIIKL